MARGQKAANRSSRAAVGRAVKERNRLRRKGPRYEENAARYDEFISRTQGLLNGGS